MSGVAVFLDLDGTLIHPMRSFAPTASTVLLEQTRSGGTAVSLDAARRVRRLAESAVVVPVTTRNAIQYARVARSMPDTFSWAITSNGARLFTPQGEDEGWRTERIGAAARWCAEVLDVDGIEALAGVLSTQTNAGGVPVVPVDDTFVVGVADDADVAEDIRRRFARACPAVSSSITRQGRKVYVIPEPITKEAACAEVRRRVGADWTIAAGDADLDAGMLAAADEGIVLGGSVLATSPAPASRPGTWAITAEAGPGGTDEVLDRVERAVSSRGDTGGVR